MKKIISIFLCVACLTPLAYCAETISIIEAPTQISTSIDAELVSFSVVPAPEIHSQSDNLVAKAGSNVVLAVISSTNFPPITYQWQFNGKALKGATNSILRLSKVNARNAGPYRVVVSNQVAATTSREILLTVVGNTTAKASVQASLTHLSREMDLFHAGLDVYTDISAPGNHFHARGQLPDETSSISVNGSWTNMSHSGATCIRFSYTPIGNDFGGYYFLNGILVGSSPLPYFGEAAVAGTSVTITNHTGLNLSGARTLSFWARGQKGGEKIQFFMGGVGRNADTGAMTTRYPDSTFRFPHANTVYTLRTNWQKYTIKVSGLNLTNIMGGFAWVADASHNPGGVVFFVDDIQYQFDAKHMAQRLNEPRFIRSYVPLAVQPSLSDTNSDDDIDLVLRNTAFTYDNALAILALLADGSKQNVQRAAKIGDAMVYAAEHDRTYTDGRLRSAYSAGDIGLPPGWTINGKSATVPIPGFYDDASMTFTEVENADIDIGNNAWGMIALLALYQHTGKAAYLDEARNLGEFIQQFRNDTGLYQGFLGGIYNAETASPTLRPYASTEHNLDIYAAFRVMYRITGETKWLDEAEHARIFVEAMWDNQKGAFLAGTLGDPNIRNDLTGQLPLDTQSWSVLSLTNALALHPQLLASAKQQQNTNSDGFVGFDFNDDRDGVWFEGTAQMAVADVIAGDTGEANALRTTLRYAQQIPAPYGNGYGTLAASHDGVSTGFNFKLFRRLHVGATSWNIFAQLGFNPYYAD